MFKLQYKCEVFEILNTTHKIYIYEIFYKIMKYFINVIKSCVFFSKYL